MMENGENSSGYESLRIDKWLWYARFVKSRSLASKLCQSGKMRLNGAAIAKSHQAVHVGDVLTFPLGPRIRVIRILALGTRRGPASEAQTLYEDQSPPPERRPDDAPVSVAQGRRAAGSGRPTKTERRAIDRLLGR